jgi:hypothetical protein
MNAIQKLRIDIAKEEIAKQRKSKKYKKPKVERRVINGLIKIVEGTKRQDKSDKISY